MLSKVQATTRSVRGKNAARRLRAEGLIPAVAYGKGKPALALQLAPSQIVSALQGQLGRNCVLEVEVEGQSTFQAMLSEYQYHPVSRELLHVDLKEVSESTFVEVKVPLILTGKAKGVVMGGKLRQVFRELPVRCLPKDIPVSLGHDITEMDVDSQVRVEALSLPEGVQVQLEGRRVVISIMSDKRGKAEEEEAAAKAGAKDAKKK